jgi:hypothetical protein
MVHKDTYGVKNRQFFLFFITVESSWKFLGSVCQEISSAKTFFAVEHFLQRGAPFFSSLFNPPALHKLFTLLRHLSSSVLTEIVRIMFSGCAQMRPLPMAGRPTLIWPFCAFHETSGISRGHISSYDQAIRVLKIDSMVYDFCLQDILKYKDSHT